MIRRPVRLVAVAVVAAALIAALIALGTWQVHRRTWKLDLIAQVNARIHAAPVAAPGPDDWPALTTANAQYRRLKLAGRFLPVAPALVQASTTLGPGFWVMSPLRSDDGRITLINRGFVPDRRPPVAPAGRVTIVGLLRTSEPGGGFLRRNDPAAGRWYSRDVAAMAAAQRLGVTAPYFIDADAASTLPDRPVLGLTLVAFRNNHLVYALTWYGLALLVAAALLVFIRAERRDGAVLSQPPPHR